MVDTVFRTEDGRYFDTIEEAESWEKKYEKMESFINKLMVYFDDKSIFVNSRQEYIINSDGFQEIIKMIFEDFDELSRLVNG
jgi:hypothetical protein